MTHRGYGGELVGYEIREHHYCFFRCNKCGAYWGSGVEETVKRLLRTKVWPTVRRA